MDITFDIPRRNYKYSKFISNTWISKKAKYSIEDSDSIIIILNDLITCKPIAIRTTETQIKLITKRLLNNTINSPIAVLQNKKLITKWIKYFKFLKIRNCMSKFKKPELVENINWDLYGEPLSDTDTLVFTDRELVQLIDSKNINKLILIDRIQLMNVILTLVLEGYLTDDYFKCIIIPDKKIIYKVEHSVVAYKEHLVFRSSKGLYIIHESVAFMQGENRSEYTLIKGEQVLIKFKKLEIQTANDVPINFLQPQNFINESVVWKSVILENELAVLNLNKEYIFKEKEVVR